METNSGLLRHMLKKLIWHISIGIAVWLLVRWLSPMGSVYAGWAAGLMGACYLLVGWLNWLKRRGTDLGAIIRRRRPPNVPYYLRGSDSAIHPRLGINRIRHTFDDDLDETVEHASQMLTVHESLLVKAVAFMVTGVLLLVLSAF